MRITFLLYLFDSLFSFKNNLDPNLTLADDIALFVLSVRDCFWQIDGRQMSKQLLNSRNTIAVSGGIMMYMIGAYLRIYILQKQQNKRQNIMQLNDGMVWK